MTADLSVIIPVYNRGDLIRYTLESVRRASVGLNVEVLVVDDGSDNPVAPLLRNLGYPEARSIRQKNQGLLLARLAGLAHISGRNVLFLDSDDLVSAEKFHRQLDAMNNTGATVSYSDCARCVLEGSYDELKIAPPEAARAVSDVATFYIDVQPPPHSPIFRTDLLRSVSACPLFPPSPLYNSVAEIWIYHNAAIHDGRVTHVRGAHTIIGSHPGARLTNHWEKLGVASLAVMEAFVRACPNTPRLAQVRRLVGEKAFRSWRRLPRDFSPEFSDRLLAIWRRLAPGYSPRLGGRTFRTVARVLGPEPAGRLFRRWQSESYIGSRTLSDDSLTRLLQALPPP